MVDHGDWPLVIDGIYENPDQVRRWALAQSFERKPNTNYAGSMTPHGHGGREMAEVLGRRLNRTILPYGSTGRFRLTLANDHARRLVHVDAPPITWAAVVYLSVPTQLTAGTRFFLAPDGRTQVPDTDAAARANGFRDRAEAVANILAGPHTLHSEVSLAFNRLVAYPSALLHAPGPAFGTSPDDGRLVQVFFFTQ